MDTISFNGKFYFYSSSTNQQIFCEIISKKTSNPMNRPIPNQMYKPVPNQTNPPVPKQSQILKQLALTVLGVGGVAAAGCLFYRYMNTFRSLKDLVIKDLTTQVCTEPALNESSIACLVNEKLGPFTASVQPEWLIQKISLNKTYDEKSPIGIVPPLPLTPVNHTLSDDELRQLSDKEFSQLTLAGLLQRTSSGQQNIILERLKDVNKQPLPLLNDELKNITDLTLSKFSRLKADQINPLIDQIPAEAFFLIDDHELEGLNLAKASKAQIENLLSFNPKQRVFYLSGHQIPAFIDKLSDSHISDITEEQFKQIDMEKLTNDQRKRLFDGRPGS